MDVLSKVCLAICYTIFVYSDAQPTMDIPQQPCSSLLSENNHRIRQLEKDIQFIKQILLDGLVQKESQYKIFYDRKTWDDAGAHCKNLSGHLVILESLAEKDAVVDMIQSPCSGGYGFWTSGISAGNDTWIWNGTDEELKSALWAPGEPSGDGNCVNLHQLYGGYPVNDAPCSFNNCYVCEIPECPVETDIRGL